MKTLINFAAAVLATCAMILPATAATPQENIVTGVFNVTSSAPNWAGVSAINVISGTSILPAAGTQTVFYISFTGGSRADISNMVLYSTTTRAGFTVASVTPVKLGGVSNPSINLASTSVCPVQPVSVTNPCVIRLDPITLVMSPLADYYFVSYFANDTNNQTVSAAVPSARITRLTGWYDPKDDTQLKTGQTLPTSNSGHPFFLVSAMNQ